MLPRARSAVSRLDHLRRCATPWRTFLAGYSAPHDRLRAAPGHGLLEASFTLASGRASVGVLDVVKTRVGDTCEGHVRRTGAAKRRVPFLTAA